MPEPGATQPADDPRPDLTGLTGALSDVAETPPFQVKIGKYQLKREIDSGGMGTVFEAIQEQPRRSVALKLMRGGTQSASALRRFEFESQLLARLRHPGIAQVFDAGTHRQGELQVPYYVMEYIPGARSITSFCDKHNYTVRQRLELFATVCEALHYAHQRGIIHRDIKPGNIIVDADGRAKIIDFGVARALDSDLTPPTLQTEADRVVGTLQYMSPEQCDADPQELDARTDVYALGVVLYELLCARLPYQLSRANLSNASRIIREQPPVAPRQVRPELSPDLETVLLKAIHKERSRRYFSAEELATDIRHVLAGEPIEARRDSASYVLRKRASALVAAHRISTWIVATAVAALLAACIIDVLHWWKPARLFFYRTITSYLAPVNEQPALSNVRMIAIRNGPDFDALAIDLGIEGFNSADGQTFRLLHGLLFKQLAKAGVRVLAMDIGFPGSRFEKEMLEGIKELKDSECEVVLAAGGDWTVGSNDLPKSISPELAAETHFGFVTAVIDRSTPLMLDLILMRAGSAPQPSLALAACAAYSWPKRYHWVDFDADRRKNIIYAKVNYVLEGVSNPRRHKAPAEGRFDLVPVSSYVVVEQDDPGGNRRKEDAIGLFILHLPPDPVIQGATVDYATVLQAEPDKLRELFEGKVVVLGDDRPGKDGPHVLPDGRSYSGFVLHAVGIDAIHRSSWIQDPRRVRIFRDLSPNLTIFGVLGTVGGAVLALAGLGAWRRRVLLILGWVIVVVGASLLFYRQRGLLFDPTAAVLGAVLAGELVSLLCRGRGDRLG